MKPFIGDKSGASHFDLERLGLKGDEWPWCAMQIEVDGGQSANFQVLCDGEDDRVQVAEAKVARAARPPNWAAITDAGHAALPREQTSPGARA
jgi:hypothetical protein